MSRIAQVLVNKILWRQKRPGENFQAGKRMAHLFPIPHETLKRREREATLRKFDESGFLMLLLR